MVDNTAPEVVVNRSLLHNFTGSRVPASWLYEVTGPDGHQFDNRSITDLRAQLRRRYGKDVQITQNWEGPARAVNWSDLNR